MLLLFAGVPTLSVIGVTQVITTYAPLSDVIGTYIASTDLVATVPD